MNQKYSVSTGIINQLENAGFPAAFLPYHCMEKITEIYGNLLSIRPDSSFIQNTVKYFRKHQPPDIPFEPLSFLIIACQGEPAQLILEYNGEDFTIPVPPTYIDDAGQQKKLDDVLKPAVQGYQTAQVRGISEKLLAVCSGLGKYGRNNVCYINESGSFHSLKAYYTDIPCEDISYPVTFLDSCESCELCKNNCPTGAIDQHSVINAEKCLTLYNENKSTLPDWIPQSAHHALIGCLRCQQICPHNKPIAAKAEHTLKLNESETQVLLSSEPEAYPPELVHKLRQFGFNNFIFSVIRRNAQLVIPR